MPELIGLNSNRLSQAFLEESLIQLYTPTLFVIFGSILTESSELAESKNKTINCYRLADAREAP